MSKKKPSKPKPNRPAGNVQARSVDDGAWELVHPRCAKARAEDLEEVEQMIEAILAVKKAGVSIIVSEQNLHFAKLISDRAYIIERGRICFSGTMSELDARPDIRDAHLAL